MNDNKQVSLYDFKGHQVRVVEISGNPWFSAADVCDILDIYMKTGSGGVKEFAFHSLKRRINPSEHQRITPTSSRGKRGSPLMTVISETGLLPVFRTPS